MSPSYGGPTNVPGMLRALQRHGIDVTLLTTDNDPIGRLDVPLNTEIVKDGVPWMIHHAWAAGGRLAFAPSLVPTLRAAMRSTDLVHIHWLYNFPCVAAARIASAAGVPFVVQPRGSLDPHLTRKNALAKRVYLRTFARPLLSEARAVVFTAEQERDLAVYDAGRPQWVVPNGLDWSDYAQLPARGTFRAAFPEVGNDPLLLFLGRLAWQKGLDLLLPAFARVAGTHPAVRLVLAGPDHEGYEHKVRALVRTLGLERRVLFTGLLNRDLKLAAFVDADLFVLPSYAENFGGVIIEALACGLPVVISNQVNIHPELSQARMARVVACTVDSLAAGIGSSLADDADRARIAVDGPRFVRTRYAWDAIAPDLIAKYRTALTPVGIA